MESTKGKDGFEAENYAGSYLYCLETNPLLIDAVLYQLVRYLALDDLKSHRLVHSSWNRAITPRLRSLCRVVFRPVEPEQLEDLRLLAENNSEKKLMLHGVRVNVEQTADEDQTSNDINTRITSFTRMFASGLEKFGNSPFCEFRLVDFPFKTENGNNFFEICGRHIQGLDIRVNRKGNKPKLPTTFGNDFYPNLLSYQAPFLKRIVLFPFPGLDTASFTKVIPYLERIHFKEWSSKELLYPHNFLENLFEKSIRLHEIWISIGLENCKSVENILIAVATSGRYSFLTKLHIAYLRLSHLEILMELALQRQGRLRLSYFRIEALAHDVPTSMFEAFLRTQSVNIRELYCRRFLGSSKFGKFTFPRMIGLRKLDCELSARQVMPLKCNLRFPNLQSLNLFGTCCQIFSFDQQFSGNKVSESLTSLHFRPGLIVAGSIAGLASHFPNIRSLTLSIISKVDLKELLQSWEMMEDLELYFGDGITNIDSLLTGLPAEQCVRVVERIKSNKKLPFGLDFLIKTLDGMLDANDKHVAVSLRNFKNLKTLHLEYNAFLMSRNPAVNEVENNHDDDEVNEIRPADELEAELEESYLPSDVTGYFALARMKSLRKINLPECLFSEECCNYLIESMELVGWRFCAEASDIVPPRKA